VIPRVVVAGTSSGAGKTTVACGLIGALRRRALVVQGFKVGPDYIDPTYHRLASDRPGRNLDAFLSGPELIAPLFRHGSSTADIAVIEGVMGLFDGVSGRGELASTGHVSKLLDAPVLLVVDAASMARSAAAIVHGFRSFDPTVHVAGVIFNRVGSDHHEELLRDAVAALDIPVVGALRRDLEIATPERHLGLVPADEREARAGSALDSLAAAAERYLDLDRIIELARTAPASAGPSWSPEGPERVPDGTRVAIARGSAFSFHYEENLELLRAAGAELVPFDPTIDEALPDGVGALVLAGGFPEVYASELSANVPLRAEIAELAQAGRPILAECGGLLYLGRRLDDQPMCGVLPIDSRMTRRLTLGYREAIFASDTPWAARGDVVRGHEFHYSSTDPADGAAAWTLSARGTVRQDGITKGGVQAGYLHVHWAAFPELAHRFVACAAAVEPARR
jgi:cobyrinic acid a,c-diamide synthase